MKMQEVQDGKRLLYYEPLPEVREDGVCAVLVGYKDEDGTDRWY